MLLVPEVYARLIANLDNCVDVVEQDLGPFDDPVLGVIAQIGGSSARIDQVKYL